MHHTLCMYILYICIRTYIQYSTYVRIYVLKSPQANLCTCSNIPPLYVQIVVEEFLEDINNMLNSGEVSALRVHRCVHSHLVQDPLCIDHILYVDYVGLDLLGLLS